MRPQAAAIGEGNADYRREHDQSDDERVQPWKHAWPDVKVGPVVGRNPCGFSCFFERDPGGVDAATECVDAASIHDGRIARHDKGRPEMQTVVHRDRLNTRRFGQQAINTLCHPGAGDDAESDREVAVVGNVPPRVADPLYGIHVVVQAYGGHRRCHRVRIQQAVHDRVEFRSVVTSEKRARIIDYRRHAALGIGLLRMEIGAQCNDQRIDIDGDNAFVAGTHGRLRVIARTGAHDDHGALIRIDGHRKVINALQGREIRRRFYGCGAEVPHDLMKVAIDVDVCAEPAFVSGDVDPVVRGIQRALNRRPAEHHHRASEREVARLRLQHDERRGS